MAAEANTPQETEVYTPQNLLAKVPSGRIISVKDAIEEKIEDKLSCPCCKKELRLRAVDSEHKQPYFSHLPNEACIDYKTLTTRERTDSFHKREMGLTRDEVENLKERIAGLEYIYEFLQRNQRGLTEESKKEFFIALSSLDYEDQVFIYDYSSRVSCLKNIRDGIRDLINQNALKTLADKFPNCSFEFTGKHSYTKSYWVGGKRKGWRSYSTEEDRGGIVPHRVQYTIHPDKDDPDAEKQENTSYLTSDMRIDNSRIYLTPSDMKRILREVGERVARYKNIQLDRRAGIAYQAKRPIQIDKNSIEITRAIMLTKEEVENLPPYVSRMTQSWWVRSNNDKDCAYTCNCMPNNKTPECIFTNTGATRNLRPAFVYNPNSCKLNLWDRVQINRQLYTVIPGNKLLAEENLKQPCCYKDTIHLKLPNNQRTITKTKYTAQIALNDWLDTEIKAKSIRQGDIQFQGADLMKTHEQGNSEKSTEYDIER